MMSCGLLWERIPRCHLDRRNVRGMRGTVELPLASGTDFLRSGESVRSGGRRECVCEEWRKEGEVDGIVRVKGLCV